MTITPYAVVAFVLIACILVGTWPAGRARLRRYDLARARRARRSEDRAWRLRENEAELARSLRAARYDALEQLGGHSLAVLRDPEPGLVISSHPEEAERLTGEFALGLGEIDGGGK